MAIFHFEATVKLPKHFEAYALKFPRTRVSLVREWRVYVLAKKLMEFRPKCRRNLASGIVDLEDAFLRDIQALSVKWKR